MCRMMCLFSDQSFQIPFEYLQSFVKNCRFGNWNFQDFMAPHRAGWGFAWRDLTHSKSNSKNHSCTPFLRIKRGLRPIWENKWEDLCKIKSDMFVIHARWALPWDVKFSNVHPITIDGRTFLVHNGIISNNSFPPLKEPKYQQIFQNTKLDSRKYLLSLLDAQKKHENVSDAISSVVKYFCNDLSANGFLFNSQNVWIIDWHNSPIIQRYTYDLAINKHNGIFCVASMPLTKYFKHIPNKTLLHYDFSQKEFGTIKLRL